MKRLIGKVDLTPTWSAVLPILIDAFKSNRSESASAAHSELIRMAELADLYVASQKATKS